MRMSLTSKIGSTLVAGGGSGTSMYYGFNYLTNKSHTLREVINRENYGVRSVKYIENFSEDELSKVKTAYEAYREMFSDGLKLIEGIKKDFTVNDIKQWCISELGGYEQDNLEKVYYWCVHRKGLVEVVIEDYKNSTTLTVNQRNKELIVNKADIVDDKNEWVWQFDKIKAILNTNNRPTKAYGWLVNSVGALTKDNQKNLVLKWCSTKSKFLWYINDPDYSTFKDVCFKNKENKSR